MGLIHEFAVLSKDSNESIISSDMDSIIISDIIIEYISDSLKWVHTIWNGKKVQEGISYYGYSFIEGDEIEKFKNIISQWKELFCFAPKEFYLTGDFLPDENCYSKNLIKKNEIIKVLESCINMCEKAMDGKHKILHIGI